MPMVHDLSGISLGVMTHSLTPTRPDAQLVLDASFGECCPLPFLGFVARMVEGTGGRECVFRVVVSSEEQKFAGLVVGVPLDVCACTVVFHGSLRVWH